MCAWRIDEGSHGLRLIQVTQRGFDSEHLTWAELLTLRLRPVQTYALYFPSRFDLPSDTVVTEALRTFGQHTGPATSVNIWDPTDPQFTRALELFDLHSPPALVLATGLRANKKRAPNATDLYTITFTSSDVLGDREKLAAAVNAAHEILTRGDQEEIARYLQQRATLSLLTAIGNIAATLRDQILRFKPKFGLPGGVSLQLG